MVIDKVQYTPVYRQKGKLGILYRLSVPRCSQNNLRLRPRKVGRRCRFNTDIDEFRSCFDTQRCNTVQPLRLIQVRLEIGVRRFTAPYRIGRYADIYLRQILFLYRYFNQLRRAFTLTFFSSKIPSRSTVMR